MYTESTKLNVVKEISVAGALMIEHRFIERMIRILDREAAAAENTGKMPMGLLDAAVDFFKTYADLRHHGKEEYILFAELNSRDLSPGHRAVLRELLEEHAAGRERVAGLASLTGQYKESGNGALYRTLGAARALCKFYRAHIQKEDRRFFIPVMRYFTKEERARMLERFRKFDANIPEKNYKNIVERFEQALKGENYAENTVRENKKSAA